MARHIDYWEVLVSLPMFVVFLFRIRSQGGLTIDWAVWLAFIWAVAGAAVAVMFWYIVVLPMKRQKR